MHRLKIAALTIFPMLAFVCLSDTAQGQTITVQNSSNTTITSLTFNVPAGTSYQSSAAQQVITVLPSAGPATLQITQQNQGAFLYVNGANSAVLLNSVPTTGTTVTVAVNAVGTTALTSYLTTFNICYSGTATCATISVTMNVSSGSGSGNSGTLSTSPSNSSAMSFSALQGSNIASPTSQNLEILNSATSLSYTMTTTEQSGGSWIILNTNATTAAGVENSTQVPVSVSASILPTLGVGAYTGTITATDTAGNSISIIVNLTVSNGQVLTPSALGFTFLYQVNGTLPAAQTLSLTSNSGSQSYSAVISPSVSWLLNPPNLSGTATTNTPGVITLGVNPSGLLPGTYTTNLIVYPFSGSALTPIPITLVVSNNPLLQLSTSSMTFLAAFAGSSPPSQTVQLSTLGNTSTAVSFTAGTDAAWLTVSPNSGSTPVTLTVTVNTSTQPVGTYTGHVTVRPSNGDNYTETITVSLTVSNSAQIAVAPSNLLFSYETTKTAPSPQSIQVLSSTTTGTTFTYSVNANTCSGSNNWLSVTPSSTTTSSGSPATLLIGVAAASLSPGICTGTIAVSASGSTTPVNINITVAITNNTALLSIQQQPGFGYFSVQQSAAGVSPQQSTLGLSSTDPGTQAPFSVGVQSDRGWLSLFSTSGTTPQNVTLQAFASGLAAGTYGGTVTISSANLPAGVTSSTGAANSFTIPITMVVSPNVTITPSASALAFNYTSNGAAPATQALTLTASGGVASYTASVVATNNCPSLLNLTPSSGTLNPSGSIILSIASTNSAAGTITCQISLTYLNASTAGTTIPVTLTIASPVSVTAAPSSLNYTYTVGAATQPAAQQVTVSSTGGSVQFSVGTTTTGNGNWLSVDTTTGTTGGTGSTLTKVVNVSVSTSGLTGSAAGTAYTGTITISASGVLATPITIPVTLTVTQPPNPQPTLVTNNASNVAGVIAPGELITIKGTLMGPANGVSFGLTPQGGVASTLSNVQVTFDGIPGTPIYVSAAQINVTTPWEISGRTSTNIVVTYNGNASSPINVRVNEVAPGIYTLNSTGSGQAAAVNQNGTYNGPIGGSTIPAPPNTVVILYATGCGQTSPPGTTGSVAPTTQLLQVTAPVSVAFGQLSNPLYGKVTFIGGAPGLVTGVCQINVQLPTGLPSGSQPVTLTVNGVSSPLGPTIAAQ